MARDLRTIMAAGDYREQLNKSPVTDEELTQLFTSDTFVPFNLTQGKFIILWRGQHVIARHSVAFFDTESEAKTSLMSYFNNESGAVNRALARTRGFPADKLYHWSRPYDAKVIAGKRIVDFLLESKLIQIVQLP